MEQKEQKKHKPENEEHDILVRIFGYDIPANKKIQVGLTRIKGISWSISNIICLRLGLDKNMKIGGLGKEGVSKIEKALLHLEIPDFMKNRRADFDTGEHKHLLANDLEMRKEFDIKRLKKIKSYKGVRHSSGLPVRGQRTRSHFRKKGKSVGVKKNDKKT
jgi:small subunit ribosomal protein S13